MNKPYIFYPVIILLFIITLIEIWFSINGFERVKVKLRSVRTTQSRKCDNYIDIEDKEEW